MINNYQTPIDFELKSIINKTEIEYSSLHEICQGGPVVGALPVNKKIIYDSLFGGPFLQADVDSETLTMTYGNHRRTLDFKRLTVTSN